MPQKTQKRARHVAPGQLVTIAKDCPRRDLLNRKARRVTKKEWKKLPNLIEKMRQVLKKYRGQGLAANQVGSRLAVAIIETRKTKSRRVGRPSRLVLVNPKIVDHSKEKFFNWEGCLSVLDVHGKKILRAQVPRYRWVTLEFRDLQGEHRRKRLTGLAARVAQHEIDHLQGILFLQRVDYKKKATSVLCLVPH